MSVYGGGVERKERERELRRAGFLGASNQKEGKASRGRER